MKKLNLFILCLCFPFLVAHAAVPSRIVYQGRLSKSGVGAAGRHTITVQFVDAAGTNLSQSQTFDVDVPTSGDFSLEIDHIPADADWINGLPKMRVIVGGETLTPDQAFSAAPYALVARNVENLTTDKVKLAGSDLTISSWQSPTDKSMISASVIAGTVSYIVPDNISPSKIEGVAVVLTSSATQILQPTDNLVPLTLKGHAGSSANLFDVWDYFSVPEKRFHIKASGNAYFSGNVGIGTENPESSLHVNTTGSYVATLSNKSAQADSWLKIENDVQDYLIGVRGGIDSGFSIYDDVVHSDRFIITRSGNVGIGVDAPIARLDVNGGANFRGPIAASAVSSTGRFKDKTGDVMPVGTVLPFAGSAVPPGWLDCDGMTYEIASRPDLEELRQVLGSTYGGNGVSTFKVPDLRGRAPIGDGQGIGLSPRYAGGLLGEETHQLTIPEMPSHNHGVNDPGHNHSMPYGGYGFGGSVPHGANSFMGYENAFPSGTSGTGISINNNGGGGSHNNMPPSLVLNYIIKY
jgi:microcystin-dependent protein